jgi:hypothetical protein
MGKGPWDARILEKTVETDDREAAPGTTVAYVKHSGFVVRRSPDLSGQISFA